MKKVNADAMRKMLMIKLMNFVDAEGMDALQNAGGSFSVPVVAEDGEEGYATISVVMRDKDRDGNPYDGYVDQAQYEAELLKKQVKADERARISLEKQAAREAKDAAKAAKESAKAAG